MNQNEIIIVGVTVAAVAGAAWWFFFRDDGLVDGTNIKFVKEIETGKKGWQVFDDGTEIDPDGNYWFQGKQVWTKP